MSCVCVCGRDTITHTRWAYHDVCVPIEKLDELLEAPEAALHAAQYEPCTRVLCRWVGVDETKE